MDKILSGLESLAGDYIFTAVPAFAFLVPNLLNIHIFTLIAGCFIIYKWSLSYIKRVRCKKDTDEQLQILAIKSTLLYIFFSSFLLIGYLMSSETFNTLNEICNNTIGWAVIGYFLFRKWMDWIVTCNVN